MIPSIVLRKIKRKIDLLRYRKLYFWYRKCCEKQKVSLPSEEIARKELYKLRKHDKQQGCCKANHIIGRKKYDLTIIVPAYNVERYIVECLNSILNQITQYQYIVKVIDDGSTDATKEILNQYEKDSRIEIIHQSNRGLSGARNAGLEKIESNYILFCDGDDILKQGSIQTLLGEAYHNDLDIVEGSYEIFDNKKVISHHLHNKKLIFDNDGSGGLFGFAWNKVIRSELFREIKFNEGYFFEDTIGIYIIFPKAKRIGLVNKITYGYRRNNTGIMHCLTYHTKAIDTYWIIEQLLYDIDRMKLDINRSYLYKTTLRQIVTNYSRTWFFEEKIQKELFVLVCNLIHTYFPKENTNMKIWKDLERSLRNYEYPLYMLFLKGNKDL